MDAWSLVLRPGDEVTVSGIVVTDGRDRGLLLGPLHPDLLPGVMLDQPLVVRLDGVTTDTPAWPDAEARHARLTGVWTGRSVAVSRAVDEGPVAPLGTMDHGDPPSSEITTALQALRERGVIVGVHLKITADSRSATVTATDVRLARETLEPIFDHLLVCRAPHSSAELAAASRRITVATPEAILGSVGESTDRDGVCRSTASVQRVTPEMAEALEDVPATALELTVFLQRTSAHGG
ncbi:hypothetical protein [Clavibacter sp. MX14-G9D]|uniref:hypothetical protein n=1 Tax=Clavibacter sp. MX14-G9D TaxID=3064656 RepID=UPI00293EF621|nr:hypothetical protein [Clavibacter sp. MX14-G9D]